MRAPFVVQAAVVGLAVLLSLSPDAQAQLGACCFATGVCVDDSEDNCSAAGGTFQGLGTDCTQVVCEVRGACCRCDTGVCVVVTPLECPDLPGRYKGELLKV